MDVILFLSMFLLFIMSIVLSKFNLTHPAVLFSGVWCVSSFGCCFSYLVIAWMEAHDKNES